MTRLPLWIAAGAALFLTACSPADDASPEYKIAFVPDLTGQHGIFTMNSDRAMGRLLTPDETAQVRTNSWSPDGKKIAFFAERPDDEQIRRMHRMPDHFPLYLMNAGGGNQRRVLGFPVSSFAWSPDSRQMLFVSAFEDPSRNEPDVLNGRKLPMSAVYLLDLETGTHRRVTGFGQHCYGSWSPEGTRLALSFGDTQKSDIYVAGIDGKSIRRIVEGGGINIKPVWAPDGKRIAYVRFVSKPGGMTSEAHIVDSSGVDMGRIGTVDPYEVSWSVDGRYLLLQNTDGFVLASTTRNVTVELENKVIKPQGAIFAPDGKGVLFRSNHEGPWYIYSVGMDGANIRRVSLSLSASMFCVSPVRP